MRKLLLFHKLQRGLACGVNTASAVLGTAGSFLVGLVQVVFTGRRSNPLVDECRKPAGVGGPDDVSIEFRCLCGQVWAEWAPPSPPDTVFQRFCARCGALCFGG